MAVDGGAVDLGYLDGPVLVFGGAYSNLQALEAMLQVAQHMGIPAHRTIHTGDVVAYCAHPLQTTQLLKDSGVHCLMGNCEENVGADAADCGCGFEPDTPCDLYSRNWYAHVMSELDGANDLKAWMASRPRLMTFGVGGRRFGVVHGSPRHISKFMWESMAEAELRDDLDLLPPGLDGVVSGHSGIPFTRLISGGPGGKEQLWLNAGVIGMPANDGTARGWYALLKPGSRGSLEVSIRALTYDAGAAAKAIFERKNLERGYGDALVLGVWPSHDVLPVEEQMRTGVALEEQTMVWQAGRKSTIWAESVATSVVVPAAVAMTAVVALAIASWARSRQPAGVSR